MANEYSPRVFFLTQSWRKTMTECWCETDRTNSVFTVTLCELYSGEEKWSFKLLTLSCSWETWYTGSRPGSCSPLIDCRLHVKYDVLVTSRFRLWVIKAEGLIVCASIDFLCTTAFVFFLLQKHNACSFVCKNNRRQPQCEALQGAEKNQPGTCQRQSSVLKMCWICVAVFPLGDLSMDTTGWPLLINNFGQDLNQGFQGSFSWRANIIFFAVEQILWENDTGKGKKIL